VTKAERTRQYIIEQTAPVFNVKGFDGTSLHDLTEATGLTKGAIYGNFVDKEEIAMEAFSYSIKKVKQMIRESISKAVTAKSQLLAMLDFYAEYVFHPPIKGGCPLLNTAVEADDYHKSMRSVVVQELNDTVDFIAELLTNGIKAGEFKKQTNARQLAYVFFCSIEGGVMFSRAERSDEPMKMIVLHCKKILDQISL
jgi:AcrR family transcriptional regulator